jgi:isocitrate/isopropylmalate dehydrogenase
MMPEDGLERLEKFDAIYFGAVGAHCHGKTNTLAHSTPRVCAGAGKLVRTLG